METEGGGVDNRPPIDDDNLPVEAMDTQEADQTVNAIYSIEEIAPNEDTAMVLASNENVVLLPNAQQTTPIIGEVDSTTGPIISPPQHHQQPIPPTTIASARATTTTPAIIDATMDEEETRAEATFKYTVDNFSKLKESVLSPPCFVRNLPWKIMVMPRMTMGNDRSENRSLGFFLQCNGESDSSSWSCKAMAELRLLSFKLDQDPFVRKINHLFYSKENDWGFSHFISWNEIVDPEKGYIQDDCVVLEVHVVAEAPHGVFWDSKKHTGYVGLKNQGATCYMNSLLQTMYFTNQLRKAVYKMPTEADDSSKSVALALQRVFHDLQFLDKPVGTKKLTKSFGWEALDSFMQHDVQEFLRVLLDKLESKMKRTCVEGTVPSLFEGKMSSYIKCKNVDYKSNRLETFYDIQLNIKGKKNIAESFKDYIATETLEGENKYDAGVHGLQEAEKGVIFVSFPPILHLHLMRFQYDSVTDNSVKFNDRFEFYEHIQLDDYLQKKEKEPANYTLHAVLVHSGDNHGGHYVVYINPLGDGKWCKFDDDVVSRCTKAEAIEHNYGGVDDDLSLNAKHCSNAYMLVYIRDSALPTVLQEIKESEIPTELIERLAEERRMEQVRRRERAEANTYMTVNVLLEDYFEGIQTTDLFDLEKNNWPTFKMKKTQTVMELVQTFVDAFRTPAGKMRLWPLSQRNNQITRPTLFDYKEDVSKNLINCADMQNPWTIFLELLPPDSPLQQMPPFDKDRDILLFFKFYDPTNKRLNYCGLGYYNLSRKVSDLIPEMNQRSGNPPDTELTLYKEQGVNVVQKINNHNDTLENVLKEIRHITDGDVIIFEKKYRDETLELPTCDDYFRDLLYRIEVTFVDKTNPNDVGFTLELSQRMTYDQMASAVGQKINVNPYEIQFFKCQNYKDIPGHPLRCSYDGSLKDLLVYNKLKSAKKIFYQRLSMNITELESKKQFKCLWLSINMKEEKELILYPNKNGTVKTLLEEAAKQIELNPEEGSGQLRILEVSSHKLMPGPREDDSLEYLQSPGESNMANQKTYRIEEIPRDEINLSEDELLIPVSHFYKDVFSAFGIPFYIKIKQGEQFAAVKDRLQKKLGVSDKEWEKYKFALISMGRADYISDDCVINLADFKPSPNQTASSTRSFLGLEHLNKTQKRSRFSYLEKAIKIYN